MTKRRLARCAVSTLAALAATAALLNAPAAAETNIGPGAGPDTPTQGTGRTIAPGDGDVRTAAPDPIAHTDAATYDTTWNPGTIVPAAVEATQTVNGAMVHTYTPEDGSWLMAIIAIDSADAPTEYRFNNAVPDGHTAELQDDGSVVFYNSDGEPVSGISTPWALDANSAEVTTSYALDGTTLVQTIDHRGAAYPVIADPWWVPVVWVGLRVAPAVIASAPRISQAFQTCMRAGCGVVASTVVSAVSSNIPTSGNSNSPDQRPTNTCNSRNRVGC